VGGAIDGRGGVTGQRWKEPKPRRHSSFKEETHGAAPTKLSKRQTKTTTQNSKCGKCFWHRGGKGKQRLSQGDRVKKQLLDNKNLPRGPNGTPHLPLHEARVAMGENPARRKDSLNTGEDLTTGLCDREPEVKGERNKSTPKENPKGEESAIEGLLGKK